MEAGGAISQTPPTNWMSAEFYRLVDSRGLAGSDPYLNGLIIKLAQFGYHLDLLAEAAAEHVLGTGAGSITGEQMQAAVFKMEAHVEAAMHAMYSAVDMLGQVVNSVVPEIRVPEEDASFSSVKKALATVTAASGIYEAMNALETSAEFGYFYAFANTSKHRRSVRTTVEIKERDAISARLEVHIQEIQGRKGNFPERPFSQIVLNTEPVLRARIGDVLLQVNAYIDALPARVTGDAAAP